MVFQRWLTVSLARKISLLFGLAVLLTIGVTLVFPAIQMRALSEQALLLRARNVATAASLLVDVRRMDWAAVREELEVHWPAVAEQGKLKAPCPGLVFLQDGPWPARGFLREAADRLNRYRSRQYYWRLQEEGRVFRFAMAVRAGLTDRHPGRLVGLIDVRLPVPESPASWNVVVTILAGASGAVLAILVFYLATQRLVLTPVESLRRVAQQVAEGDVNVRAAIHTRDEFEQLAETFNRMLTILRAAQAEQEKINRSLDIKLGQLAETNVALYEANRLKSEFLANVSHELRTPLTSIIGFAELLRDAVGPLENQRLARYAENIRVSGRSLLDIINDLLDLAKIEAGKIELHISRFSLPELAQDLMDLMQPLADKRRQSLALTVDGTIPEVQSDAGRLKQILYNLLSNALKFTPEEGAVELVLTSSDPDRATMIVRDTGPGVPPEYREMIFEKFRQLDASKTREHEGTGLGLAITRELVEMLRGAIRIEGERGWGAVVIVDLPIHLPEEAGSARTVPTSVRPGDARAISP